MTITVRKGGIEKIVHYTESTKWTTQDKDQIKEIDKSEVKVEDRVICLGSTEKGKFTATRIDKRGPGQGAFREAK